jgi:copper transport protein
LTLPAGTPIDDFLAGAGSSTAAGERLQQIGEFGSLLGLTLAVGLIVFMALVHRGPIRETRLLVRSASIAGAILLIGAVTEAAGIARVFDTGWNTALTGSAGSAAMMRVLAGIMILMGLFDQVVATDPDDRDHDLADLGDDRPVRWVPSAASAFGLGGAAIGVLSFGFDGHTVTKGPRVVHEVVDNLHVVAGSTWFGGIVGLVLVAWSRRRSEGPPVSALIVRFSAVATVALVVVAAAGVGMTYMIIDGFGDLTGTEWGRRLIVKTIAVGVAAGIGGYNHFWVVPALEADPDDAHVARRARAAITTEAIVLVVVVVVTAFLVRASTT